MNHILKSYAEDVFFEFLAHKDKKKAILLVPGFPSTNNYDNLMYYFYEKGFNVFFMRFRGSYQSHGEFLSQDPTGDILTVIKHIQRGNTINLWDGTSKLFKNTELCIITGSFGGAVALGTSALSFDVKKIMLFAPVWDFLVHNKKYAEQELAHVTAFVKRSFQHIYRYEFQDIQQQMAKFTSCQSTQYLERIKDLPMLVFHDTNDTIVNIQHSIHFSEKLNKSKLIKHNFGHGMNLEIIEHFAEKINAFLQGD